MKADPGGCSPRRPPRRPPALIAPPRTSHLGHVAAEEPGPRSLAAGDAPEVGHGAGARLLQLQLLELRLEPLQGLRGTGGRGVSRGSGAGGRRSAGRKRGPPRSSSRCGAHLVGLRLSYGHPTHLRGTGGGVSRRGLALVGGRAYRRRSPRVFCAGQSVCEAQGEKNTGSGRVTGGNPVTNQGATQQLSRQFCCRENSPHLFPNPTWAALISHAPPP